MDEKMQLNSIEESQIRKALFQLFTECPFIPENVSKKYGDMGKDSIGMFSQQGSGRYLKKYVSGSYEAQFPFFLRYRAQPTTNGTRLNAEELLDSIAQWMCGNKVRYNSQDYQMAAFPALTDGRRVEQIESGNIFMAEKAEDGTIDYQVTMNLKYSKKGY